MKGPLVATPGTRQRLLEALRGLFSLIRVALVGVPAQGLAGFGEAKGSFFFFLNSFLGEKVFFFPF